MRAGSQQGTITGRFPAAAASRVRSPGSLGREPREITLLDVYDAVEHEPLFAMHRTEPNLECPVGHGIRPALSQVYHEIDEALRRELTRTSIADVLRLTLAVPG